MAASVLDAYALSTLINASAYLGLTPDGAAVDTQVEYLINRASDIIEDALHTKIMIRVYAKERHSGKNQTKIYFKNFPVVAVNLDGLVWDAGAKTVTRNDGGSFMLDGFADGNSILVQNSDSNSGLLTINGVVTKLAIIFADVIVADAVDNNVILSHCRSLWIDDAEIDKDSYEVHSNHIYYEVGFPRGHGNVRMTYYGGHVAIPDAVERVCLRIIKKIYEKNEGIKSEKLGPYSVTYADSVDSMKDEIRNELTKYANVVI